MNDVQVGQKRYQMPPADGVTLAHNLTVADVERSAQFYATVFGSARQTQAVSWRSVLASLQQ